MPSESTLTHARRGEEARPATLIWIDAREASIVRWRDAAALIERVESDVPPHHRDSIRPRHAPPPPPPPLPGRGRGRARRLPPPPSWAVGRGPPGRCPSASWVRVRVPVPWAPPSPTRVGFASPPGGSPPSAPPPTDGSPPAPPRASLGRPPPTPPPPAARPPRARTGPPPPGGGARGGGSLLDPIGSCQASAPQLGSKSWPLRQTPQTMLRALRMQWPRAFILVLPAARLRA